MKKHLVITLTGADQIGIVEQVTKRVLDNGGNIEASRMARLGGEFAILMLVSVEESQFDALNETIQNLTQSGFQVTTCSTGDNETTRYHGWVPYTIEVHGADHEGIIHHITGKLAKHGVNIETMDTNMVKAPMSGTPLFMMSATVLIPPEQSFRTLAEELEHTADDLNVDVAVIPFTGKK
ncbi:MAG: transcriptional regulator [Gemmatimonadetes bacterium]|nr:MAG: transcriptional regulator [Gemmatimonadota bacterium]